MKMKRDRRKTDAHVLILLAALSLLVFVNGIAGLFTAKAQPAVTKDAKFTATMVGDMMFSRNIEEVVQAKGYDFLYRNVKNYLAASDYNTGNFENPIIYNDPDSYTLPEKNIYLHAKPDVAKFLESIKFTNVNIANNHTMDFGVAGLVETMKAFSETKVKTVGGGLNKTASNEIHYDTVAGKKVAILGATDVGYSWGYATNHQAGANKIRLEDLMPKIAEAKANSDLVIVHSHWGIEYNTDPNPRQVSIGHALVDAGADIVVGHHSHTLQPVELYNNGVIMYSLGNFIFDQGWSKTKDSVLSQYKEKEDGTRVLELTPMKIHEGAPDFLKGPLAGFEYNRMSRILTKKLDASKYTKENGKIIIQLPKK